MNAGSFWSNINRKHAHLNEGGVEQNNRGAGGCPIAGPREAHATQQRLTTRRSCISKNGCGCIMFGCSWLFYPVFPSVPHIRRSRACPQLYFIILVPNVGLHHTIIHVDQALMIVVQPGDCPTVHGEAMAKKARGVGVSAAVSIINKLKVEGHRLRESVNRAPALPPSTGTRHTEEVQFSSGWSATGVLAEHWPRPDESALDFDQPLGRRRGASGSRGMWTRGQISV